MRNRPGHIVPVFIGNCDPESFHLGMPQIQHVDLRHPCVRARQRLLEAFLPHAAHLTGSLEVLVLRSSGRRWNVHSIRDTGVLPVGVGDRIRIEAGLNRPAYLYSIWFTGEGEVQPVYPWMLGSWDNRPENERPVDHIELPEADCKVGWPVKGGPGGLETVMLMARDEVLSPTVDLRALLRDLPAENVPDDPSACLPFESRQPGRPAARFRGGVDLSHPSREEEPRLGLHAELLGRLDAHCDLILGTSFTNRGNPS